MKQYKIREIKVNGEQEEITLAESDAIRIYKIWKRIKDKEVDENLDAIVKVDLPKDEIEAMKLLKGGIIIDDKRYISLATTPQ